MLESTTCRHLTASALVIPNSTNIEQNELGACSVKTTSLIHLISALFERNRKEQLLNLFAQITFLIQRQQNTVRHYNAFFDVPS